LKSFAEAGETMGRAATKALKRGSSVPGSIDINLPGCDEKDSLFRLVLG